MTIDTRTPRSRVSTPGASKRRRQPGSSTPLTARGGVVAIFAITAVGSLAGSLTGTGWPAGASFVLGCLLAVLSVRPPDLLGLTVSPPVTYLAVIVVGEFFGMWSQSAPGAAAPVRLVTDLIAAAPWLFTGTLLVVGIALARGLPANIRELNERLAAERENPPPQPARRPGTARTHRRGTRAAGRRGTLLRRKGRDDAAEDPVRWDEEPPL